MQALVLLNLLALRTNRSVVLGQVVCELLVWGLGEDSLLPQVWSQVRIGLGNGSIGSFGKVAKGSSASGCRGVAILNSGHGQKLLGDWGRDDTGTTRGRDQTHPDGTALSCVNKKKNI